MHMTRSKSASHCDTYVMRDSALVEVDGFKLLGATFSKDLSFDSHIDAVSNKVSKLSVSSLGAQETCPLMLRLTSMKLLSCHI